MIEVPARFNAATFFVDRHVAEGRGAKVAFFHDEGSITYAGLQELVNRTGNALLDLGVRPEQRVLCLLLDSPEFLGAFWGAIKIGAVPIPANTMLRADDYLYFLDDSRAPVAIVSEALLAEAAPALAKARYLRHVIVAGARVRDADRLRGAGWPRPPRGSSPSTARRTMPRSGSTPRAPRAGRRARCTCSTTWWCARTPTRSQVLGMTEADRTVSAAKLFFAYGLGNNGYFPLRRGRPGRALPASADAGRDVRADPAPPPDALLRRAHALRRDAAGEGGGEALRPLVPPPLRLRGRGAARGALPALAGALRRRDPRRDRHHRDPAHLPVEPAGRARGPGRPVWRCPGTRRSSWTTRAARCPPGRSATCASRATRSWPTTGTSTRRRRTRCSATWMQTGDKYYQDADGYFWYCGRADDMLKVGGIWVSPVEVENTLIGPSRHPGDRGGGPRGHRRADQAEGLRGAEGRRTRPPRPSRPSSRPS